MRPGTDRQADNVHTLLRQLDQIPWEWLSLPAHRPHTESPHSDNLHVIHTLCCRESEGDRGWSHTHTIPIRTSLTDNNSVKVFPGCRTIRYWVQVIRLLLEECLWRNLRREKREREREREMSKSHELYSSSYLPHIDDRNTSLEARSWVKWTIVNARLKYPPATISSCICWSVCKVSLKGGKLPLVVSVQQLLCCFCNEICFLLCQEFLYLLNPCVIGTV